MTTVASGLVLGFLMATLYGAGFHVIMGGRPRMIIAYLIASWIGFMVGHFIGDFFGIESLKLGAVYLLSASGGSWLALVIVWLFSRNNS
jgi:uncharacterized membrane protein YeaQ/YmgE (transglycosylase-associated protein family)